MGRGQHPGREAKRDGSRVVSRAWLFVLLVFGGCAERQKFWKDVHQSDQAGAGPHDYDAGQKPNEE